ncbi:MAG: phosphoribosylglycinamide formyltransferase [Alphaproteobacteria bacterium]|nr:phosphoribosylglycinamide formyltransferase [Alphaproteobacteria bacterium]
MSKKRVAVLISGSGSNLQALIDAASHADYPAEIAVVISNTDDAYGLERARQADIRTEVLRHNSYPTREAYDAALHEILLNYNTEVVCLAGFMRILSAAFVEKWSGKMLNIHPSLLPAYRGLHTHERALADGATEAGCTVHYVVPELDAGPHILQAKVPVLPKDTPETLAARVLEQEHRIYPEALRQHCVQSVAHRP